MFILGGLSGYPHMFIHSLYIHTPPNTFIFLLGVTHPHLSPYSCASVCSQMLLHVVGGYKAPLHVGHPLYTPVWGCLPFRYTPSTHLLASPCIGMVWGYRFGDTSMLYGNISHMFGVWGCSPLLGVLGCALGVHMHILVHSCSSLCLTFLLQL